MPRLVMKFGGTSVADLDRIRNAAAKVKREVEAGYEVAVVVSAAVVVIAVNDNLGASRCQRACNHFAGIARGASHQGRAPA